MADETVGRPRCRTLRLPNGTDVKVQLSTGVTELTREEITEIQKFCEAIKYMDDTQEELNF